MTLWFLRGLRRGVVTTHYPHRPESSAPISPWVRCNDSGCRWALADRTPPTSRSRMPTSASSQVASLASR